MLGVRRNCVGWMGLTQILRFAAVLLVKYRRLGSWLFAIFRRGSLWSGLLLFCQILVLSGRMLTGDFLARISIVEIVIIVLVLIRF